MAIIYTQGKRTRHGLPVPARTIGPQSKPSKPSWLEHAVAVSDDAWFVRGKHGYERRTPILSTRHAEPKINSRLTARPIDPLRELWRTEPPENPGTKLVEPPRKSQRKKAELTSTLPDDSAVKAARKRFDRFMKRKRTRREKILNDAPWLADALDVKKRRKVWREYRANEMP